MHTDSSIPVLRVSGLTKLFGGRPAVQDLSFDVYEGDIFGFLGPNGAGKSTTIYSIAGLVRPTSGRIEIFGEPHTHGESVRSRMGMLIETPAFYEYLSARKNLEILARIQGGIDRTRIDAVLDQVGLLSRAGDRVNDYSHGMKQRLGIAQALLHQPRFLVLDEPTNGLDPEGSAAIWDLLRQLVANEGMTILISSHLLHEVEEGCNRIAVINQGLLVACDQVRNLLFFSKEEYLVVFNSADQESAARRFLAEKVGVEVLAATETGASGEEHAVRIRIQQGVASDLVSGLASSGMAPRAVIPQRKTLKQFFLELTRRQPRSQD